jgi:hypothetical protein
MSEMSFSLTADEIEELIDILHQDVQFYNSEGSYSNASVLAEIRSCFLTHCLKEVENNDQT